MDRLEELEKAYNSSDYDCVEEILNESDLTALCSTGGDNSKAQLVFHKLASLLVSEQQVSVCVEFTIKTVTSTQLRVRFPGSSVIQDQLNSPNEEGKTPLCTAIIYRKIVLPK